ncbi:MAG: 30S ribosomal protein S21 [Planctomycetes bacterium]|nr:30S ribosomal protein S21 [Planctomycetota bacterium]
MIKVKSRLGESVEMMVKRFKKMCEKEGLIRDMKRLSYYEKPSEKNRRRRRKTVRSSKLTTNY